MMKIIFHLGWLKPSTPRRKFFKSSPAQELFSEYQKRIRHFTPCETASLFDFSAQTAGPSHVLWVCDLHPRAKMLRSEELAAKLEGLAKNSARTLHLVIGGADGFSEAERRIMKPDFIWSFGPQTLPHELAAVVAAEQIYRAWTILRHLPYHGKHGLNPGF